MIKAGFYSPYLDTFGGGERYLLTLASRISQDNEVDIFWDDLTIKAPLARFLKIDLSKVNFKSNIFSKGTLKKAVATKKYDLIFVLSDGSIPLTFARKNIIHFQVPFKFSKIDFLSKTKLSKYQFIVCNSHFTKSFIDQSFKTKSLVIYPPVETEAYRQGEKEKIILSVGRFSKNQLHPKKQEVLIEVFKELYRHNNEWKLILVGQAKKEDMKYLRNLKKISRGYAIQIIENLEVEKLRKLYSKTSIYWHATGFGEDEKKFPEKMEHFGISTVEAQASGAVPIVIAKGGQKEIVEEGINGLLWETKTQLLEKTLSLINNKERLTKLAGQAQKNSKRFSSKVFFKEYEKLIF